MHALYEWNVERKAKRRKRKKTEDGEMGDGGGGGGEGATGKWSMQAHGQIGRGRGGSASATSKKANQKTPPVLPINSIGHTFLRDTHHGSPILR